MRHLTYGDKQMLIGDEVAAVLLEYAAQVARVGGGDSMTLRAIDTDGNDVEVTLLLDAGATLMSQTATTSVEEPDNREAVAYMRQRLGIMRSPAQVQPFSDDEAKRTHNSHLEMEL